MSEAVETACPYMHERGDAEAVRAMIGTEAWTDATLALITLDLPNWSLRRLGREDGQWWCALAPGQTAHWAEPEIDERHVNMVCAMLKALISARYRDLEQALPTECVREFAT